MDLQQLSAALKQPQVTLITVDTSDGIEHSPLSVFRRFATASTMKTIKNILAIPPKSPPKSSFIGSSNAALCKECSKKFRPTITDQVHCSVNCERLSSWMELNEQHRGMMQHRRRPRTTPVRDLDAVIHEVTQSSPTRSTHSSSEKLCLAGPSTLPRLESKPILRTSSSKAETGRPRRVLRKRHPSSFDGSRAPPCLVPSVISSSTSSSPLRTSFAVSASSSESDMLYMAPLSYADPDDTLASARLALHNLSSPTLSQPVRPRFSSTMTASRSPSYGVTPFLARKPSHPISSTSRPIPTRSITHAAGQAPPTSPPDSPARLRPGNDRRAPRPRSNSFGGFDSLVMHGP
ncbi:hypothetical protein BD309DRAFT_1002356 [Dichomitus squalens]|nr:hypothetical protein BD309DRAFT_1002356 [Dichomitus squalens]